MLGDNIPFDAMHAGSAIITLQKSQQRNFTVGKTCKVKSCGYLQIIVTSGYLISRYVYNHGSMAVTCPLVHLQVLHEPERLTIGIAVLITNTKLIPQY